MRKDLVSNFPRLGILAASVLAAVSGPAQAFEFDTDSGWRGSFNNTVSVGASWRVESPDNELYSRVNGLRVGKSDGLGGSNTDSGNLNWDKGDRFSTLAKVVSELSVRRDEMGAFVRAKAWYDQALNDEKVKAGNGDNEFETNSRLSDKSQPNLNKFKGIELLDAYVYDTFELGQNPLQLRAGKQVVNWGESLFIQGLNQLNPLDVPSLRKPGTEIKEAFLPVWSLYGNLGIGDGMSVEGFYQFKWDPTIIDQCGGYWGPVEWALSTKAGSGCRAIATTFGQSNFTSTHGAGTYLPLSEGKDGKDEGQWGMAFRMPVDALDAEMGLYAMSINSRVPIISARTGSWGAVPVGNPARTLLNPIAAHEAAAGALGVKSASAFWEYPDNINIYGASLATNVAGWSVGLELSHTPNQPVQINGNDMLNGLLAGVGPVGGRFVGAGDLQVVHGYDRVAKTQFQVNTIKILPSMLGATQGILIAEAGFQWNDLDSATRYGRAFIYGFGSSGALDTCAAGPLNNPQPDGCQDDGYMTRFSWGYRVKAQLDYPGAFGGPFTLTPSVFLGHDVAGHSSDSQFIEGRIALGLGLKVDYQKKYTMEVGYTTYANDAAYDPFRDRDYVSVSFSAAF